MKGKQTEFVLFDKDGLPPRKTDAEILEDIRRVITDLNWIITRANDLMNAGWPPEDIETERIELRNWRAIERWLSHKIELEQKRQRNS